MAAITVRPLLPGAERDAFFSLAQETFSGRFDSEAAARWRRFIETAPGFDAAQLRGAFRDGEWLGGCIIYERVLALGPARLSTACIGALVTLPAYRNQGVATALLADALALAQARSHALILLDGIPGFYQQFGYADVLEATQHHISLADIDRLPESSCRVRSAVMEDAPALLRLYHEAFDAYPGVFARTLAIQEHYLRARLPHNPPLVVEDARSDVIGYAMLPWPRQQAFCPEVVFADWPAASALLKAQVSLLAMGEERPARLWWQVPPQSDAFHVLADHIHVESTAHHFPNADWMARPGDLACLMQALLPFWQDRWRQAKETWQGDFCFVVERSTFVFSLKQGEMRRTEYAQPGVLCVGLTSQALVQFIFRFRPLAWLARQPGCSLPEVALPILQALTPAAPGWLPGTDWF